MMTFDSDFVGEGVCVNEGCLDTTFNNDTTDGLTLARTSSKSWRTPNQESRKLSNQLHDIAIMST